MLGCRVLGHKYRFTASGRTMRWLCSRRCGAGGSKDYLSAAEADRYAAAFDREDSEDLGRRASLIGLFPLRLARAIRRARGRRARMVCAAAGSVCPLGGGVRMLAIGGSP